MKQTVRFTGTKAEQEKQALQRIKDFLGTARFLALRRQLVDYFTITNPTARQAEQYRGVALACWSQGIAGYFPRRAMARAVLRIVDAVKHPVVID